MKRRIFCLTLLVLMLICFSAISVSADGGALSGSCGENVQWAFDEATGTLTIKGIGMPDNYNLLDVPWYGYASRIEKLTVEEGVTGIGDGFFYNCTALTEVSIPDSVTVIGEQAFKNCDALEYITIPDSVTQIGAETFCSCDRLTGVDLPSALKEVARGLFSSDPVLQSVQLPQSVISIGNSAFMECFALTNINIPEGVTYIGSMAFYRCSNLAEISLPANATLGTKLFSSCTSLSKVSLPAALQIIPDECFMDCTSLSQVTMPERPTAINYGAFDNCNSLTQIHIPDTVTALGNSVFFGCSSLEQITGGGGLTGIPKNAFNSCTKLKEMKIAESVTSVGSGAFAFCEALETVEIPAAVVLLDDFAFRDCTALTQIRFCGDAPEFGTDVFKEVHAIGYFLDKNSTWNSDTLANYGGRINWQEYKPGPYIAAGACSATLNWILSEEGVLTISGSGDMDDFQNGKSPWASYAEHIVRVIPEEGVTGIGAYAFGHCPNLLSVTLPATLMRIGDNAFYGYRPSLVITFTGSAPAISECAFTCTQYHQLHCYYPAEDPSWTEEVLMPSVFTGKQRSYGGFLIWESETHVIGKWGDGIVATYSKETGKLTVTGYGSTGLVGDLQQPWLEYRDQVREVEFLGNITRIVAQDLRDHSALETVHLPESLIWLGGSAFCNCTALTEVEFPPNMTDIAMNVFGGCTALTDLRFTGNAPHIQTDAFSGVTATAVYPGTNETWTADVMQNYGGNISWESEHTAVQPVLTLKFPTVSFEDEVIINAYFAAEQMEDVVEMGLLTSVDDTVDEYDTFAPGFWWSESYSMYYAETGGISAKCLGDEVYFCVYCRLSDGSVVYSRMVSYSPKVYAYSVLKGNHSTDLKALVVAMLNYGAAAQEYFNYRVDAYVNAELTQTQSDFVQAYSPELVAPVLAPDTEKMGSFVPGVGFAKKYPTVSFEGAFALHYYFTPDREPDDDVTLYYWTQTDYEAAQSLTADNATGSCIMTGNGELHGQVEGIAAKSLDETVYVCAVYSSGDTQCCSGVLAYSIGAYCTQQAGLATSAQPLAAAAAVYGNYAKAYFGSGSN